MKHTWHAKTTSQVFEELRASERGLDGKEAALRLRTHGLNKLPAAKTDGAPVIFLRQFQSPLIYILLAAALAVFIMGEAADGSIILAVLLFNALVGTVQEGKAQNTLRALEKFAETSAVVLRDGRELVVRDSEVVPGDVLILQEGVKVPADCRVFVSNNLHVDESSLTGESDPVLKTAEPLTDPNLPVFERKNMVFKGTNVTAGFGRVVAVATGSRTAIGSIAKRVASIDTEIPLKANIRYLSRLIIAAVAVMGTGVFFLGIAKGNTAAQMFATVVSIAVSVVPEGLPIVMTLILASGVWRMSKRNALVRKLQAVEALGQARVIAVDKTGTVTKNELMIQALYADGRYFEIRGNGYEPEGEIALEGAVVDPLNHPELVLAGKIAAFCANARAVYSQEDSKWRVTGDPTEAALSVFARKIGFHKDDLERESPLAGEIPFASALKYHATLHGTNGTNFLTAVGAPETILEHSTFVWRSGRQEALDEPKKQSLLSIFERMSEQGLRVVAFGMREDAPPSLVSESVNSLAFVGFFGMRDTIRPEAKDAVARSMEAGIRVVMITGDHAVTARAIAKEAGIWREGDEVITGADIDAMDERELERKIARASVFARVTPEHKLRIIRAYRARGEIVAMTGDGVNDAPSLVAADLGVAMGVAGTEVAKTAADIVLLDDNFGSIVSAVEEGRSIYKTIKKVILYLFSTSFGEVFTIAGALALGYPLPILPAQIIWLNFVTDGFLDVALAMEPKERGLLRGNFERPKKYLIDALMARRMALMALVMTGGALLLFKNALDVDPAKAGTIVLSTLAVFQWFNAWNCRSEKTSLFKTNPFSNPFLAGATVLIIFLQILAVYHPALQGILHTKPLALADWLFIVPVAFSIVVAEEVRKFFHRRIAGA